jgi:Esterase-like activity of phytase
LSPDERRLHVAFQSPLAHPTPEAHAAAAHVRIWTLDAATGALLAQHLYPLDPPERFRRDTAEGSFTKADVKLSELVVLGDGRLLCLERGSASTKLYLVALDPTCALPPKHLDPDTRPTVEEISASNPPSLPALSKALLLDTDDHPEIGHDLEGMALLAADEMLLVSDNDFGVEGAESGFWRVRFAQPIADY